MNGTIKSIKEIVHNLSSAKLSSETEVVIAPPSLYLLITREHLAPGIEVAAQNVFDKPNGAFTGEISVEQLKDSNITWTILGHSERRTILNENDDFVATKTKTAIDGGISVILCCGESLEQREQGVTTEVVVKQLEAVNKVIGKDGWSKVVIAYEPIWAIGTGKVASTEQAQEVHAAIRKYLADSVDKSVAENTRIIYGGSVSEKNCKDLSTQPDIDGFLVGGASLKPACKLTILKCCTANLCSRRHHQRQTLRCTGMRSPHPFNSPLCSIEIAKSCTSFSVPVPKASIRSFRYILSRFLHVATFALTSLLLMSLRTSCMETMIVGQMYLRHCMPILNARRTLAW